MDENLESVWENMLRLGLGALAHANWHANYFSQENNMWSELSVIQAAHAAEILIKARIAQEHPLLIFEQVPKFNISDDTPLTFERLLTEGRTFQYRDLPDRLWATTGMKLPNVEVFKEFGKLRNAVQHFAPPKTSDLSHTTLEFIFSVIDPFINHYWGLFAIDYNEDHEEYIYFVPGILRRGIPFLVSPESVQNIEHMELEFGGNSEYENLMEERIRGAREGAE